MTGCDHDQNLLLLTQGELCGFARWRVRAHLRRCAACRERHAALARASHLVAGAIREPHREPMPWMAPGVPPATRRATALAARPALALLVVLLFLFSAAAVALRLRARSAAAPVAVPCRPDLPNDRCR